MSSSRRRSGSPSLRELWPTDAFQSLFDEGRMGLILVGPDLAILDANEAWCGMTGYSLEQLKRLTVRDLTHPEDLPDSLDFLEEGGGADVPRQMEKRYLHASGREFWGRARTRAVRDEDGVLRYALVMVVDITEDKRRESASREATRRLETIADNVPGYISYVDRELRYHFVNRAYEQRYQRRREDILGRSISEILPSAGWVNARPHFERALRGERLSFEGRFSKPEGHALVQLVPRLEDGEVQGIFILVTDVTEMKKAEERLREANALLHSAFENREQLAAIVEASQDAILRLAMDGTIQFWSKGAERIYGYRAEEIVGRNADVLVPGADAAVRESIRVAIARGESLSFPDSVRMHKDGHEVAVSISIFPIRNADGHIVGCASVHHDIRELKQLEEQLRHAQRLETAGELAGGIAHDFNNILTVVQGNASSLALEFQDDPKLAQKCAAIDRAVQRASRLIRQLLTFSRKQRIEKRLMDPNETLEELGGMLRRSLPREIEVRSRLLSSWLVNEDPMQFEQIVLNLSLNAGHAMAEGGTLLIETANHQVEESGEFSRCDWGSLCYCPQASAPGPYVRLSITDSGSGMNRQVLERIFEPFFTTKSKGEGTGLGLAVVYGMVTQGGGAIRVQTHPGEGSRFEVFFPRAPRSGAHSAASASPAAASATILVVEDNADILTLTRQILESEGYRVLCEQNPRAALERDYGENIDFILSDVMMPGLNGPEFVERWLERHPGTPCLFMSGYADEAALAYPLAARDLLQKPFTAPDLLRRIREALEAAR